MKSERLLDLLEQPAKSAAYGPWKPLMVCPDTELAGRLRAACAELGIDGVTHLAQYPHIGALDSAIAERQANLCLIDVAAHAEFALLLIGEASASVPVVALNTRNDADLILRCLRRGACEFLAEPGAGPLASVLDRLRLLSAPAEPPKPCEAYCVIPGKPGCGASTLAVHLAVELHRAGAARVLLVDTDVQGSAIAFLLKLKPDFHLGDAVRDRQRMDHDLWGRLAVSTNGIDVLLAPENPTAAVEIDRAAAHQLMTFWRSHYEAIVIDTAGAQPAAIEFARLSDQILLVSTNELVALHSTRRSIECLEHHLIERRRLLLIMNRYTPSTGLKRDEVETALKLAPYALLANEYDLVQQAVLEGRPLGATSRFARGVHALAERLAGSRQPAKKRTSLFGLLQHRS
jgi:pilus assembly protein CpaE